MYGESFFKFSCLMAHNNHIIMRMSIERHHRTNCSYFLSVAAEIALKAKPSARATLHVYRDAHL